MPELNNGDRAQMDGADLNEFRRLGHEMIDWVADYLERVETQAVLPATRPGSVRSALPSSPPEHAEPLADCFADFIVNDQFEVSAVIGVIIVALTFGVALIARLIGLRLGIMQSS